MSDDRVVVVKENRKSCCGGCLTFFAVFTLISLIVYPFLPNEYKTDTPETESSISSHAELEPGTSEPEPTEEVSDPVEEESEADEVVNFDTDEFNSRIIDSFIESQEFDDQGEDGYEWTRYVSDIIIDDNERIRVEIVDDFFLLDDDSKSEVLSRVNSMVGAEYFLMTEEQKTFLLTAYNSSGDKIASNSMFNTNEYTFE